MVPRSCKRPALAEAEVEYEDLTSTQIDRGLRRLWNAEWRSWSARTAVILGRRTPWTEFPSISGFGLWAGKLSYRLLEIVDGPKIAGQPPEREPPERQRRFVICDGP